jgi:uncharacterized circularly permuted ATP-grasp superfamily protein
MHTPHLNKLDSWSGPSYEEAFDENGRPRPAYVALAQRLRWDPLYPPGPVVKRLSGRPLGDDHEMLPFPLAVDDAEYRALIQAGIAQRARALQVFFADVVLDDGRFLDSGGELTRSLFDEILASEGTSIDELRYWWNGHDPGEIRFVYGPDLAREPGGRWVVLEDNVGCVGGCADSFFVQEAYRRATELPADSPPHSDLGYAVMCWLDGIGLAPNDPGVLAMLSDGDYLDVYLPKRYEEDGRRMQLVQQLGVQTIDNDDFEQICRTGDPLRAIINIGVPSNTTWALIFKYAFAELKVPLLNAPGTSVLGNKALSPFVTDMIRYFLHENTILPVPPTIFLRDGRLPYNADEWVVKIANDCMGSGVHILQAQTPESLQKIETFIEKGWPESAAIAQRYFALSQLWTARLSGEQTYLVEVRALAYVLGWQDVFAGEHSLGKLVPGGRPGSLNNIARGGSYAPVIRESLSDQAQSP